MEVFTGFCLGFFIGCCFVDVCNKIKKYYEEK